MIVEDLKKIEILPNGKDGVKLSVNGERVPLKGVDRITFDVLHDTGNKDLIFKLSARQTISLLTNYEQDKHQ